jgi:phospholipid/cholesterol/gamma-HCH transport system substrate-binding protein
MAKKAVNHIKLGIFVLAGLLFLIIMLYMIGKDQNLFGSTFVLKTRFENVQGLVPGNNVRYAGIEVGTVRRIQILNDTLVEVIMMVQNKMKPFIRNNAVTTIGTDGLMGNKVINIVAARKEAAAVSEGDVLASRPSIDSDEMLRTLNKTNRDIAVVAENLKTTVLRINNSKALWKLLNDEGVPDDIRTAASQVKLATVRAAGMMTDLNNVVADIKDGKGSLGRIVRDTVLAIKLDEAIDRINGLGEDAGKLAEILNETVSGLQQDVNHGKGPVNALLKDSAIVVKLNNSLDNIEKGTEAFNQNMEALKHNFLFRGYFRKLEKQKQKAAKDPVALH